MTDNKLADALRDIQQYLQMTAPSPDCGHLLQITVDALAEHDAEKAEPDGDYVLVPEVTDEDIFAGLEAINSVPDGFRNNEFGGMRACLTADRARLLASAEQGAK